MAEIQTPNLSVFRLCVCNLCGWCQWCHWFVHFCVHCWCRLCFICSWPGSSRNWWLDLPWLAMTCMERKWTYSWNGLLDSKWFAGRTNSQFGLSACLSAADLSIDLSHFRTFMNYWKRCATSEPSTACSTKCCNWTRKMMKNDLDHLGPIFLPRCPQTHRVETAARVELQLRTSLRSPVWKPGSPNCEKMRTGFTIGNCWENGGKP